MLREMRGVASVACWSLVVGKVTTETGVSVRVGWDRMGIACRRLLGYWNGASVTRRHETGLVGALVLGYLRVLRHDITIAASRRSAGWDGARVAEGMEGCAVSTGVADAAQFCLLLSLSLSLFGM